MNALAFATASIFAFLLLPAVIVPWTKSHKWSILCPMGTGLSLLAAVWLQIKLPQQEILSSRWIALPPDVSISFTLQLDNFTRYLWLLILGLAWLIEIYALWYMEHDRHKNRFFAYLNVFVAAMMLVPAAGNLLHLFLGWELVGLTSYLLIGFWNSEPSNIKAATQAFWVNRLADLGFILGMGCYYHIFHTLEIKQIDNDLHIKLALDDHYLAFYLGGLGFLLAVLGKSAQFPLHVWLPDAMRGPTPVSALLHAATMVIAGVLLLLRLSHILPPAVLQLAMWIGLISAAWGTVLALLALNLKQILAYSTMSQIGLMLAGIGAGSNFAGIYHLFTHAAYKAGLFLVAGFLLHNFHIDDQASDSLIQLRAKGKDTPLIMMCMAILLMGLAGLPLSAGFISKELVTFSVYHSLSKLSFVPAHLGLALLATSLVGTAAYCAKIFLTINGGFAFKFKTDKETSITLPKEAAFPIILLSLGALWFSFSWHPMGGGEYWLTNLKQLWETPPTVQAGPWFVLFPISMATLGVVIGAMLAKDSSINTRLIQLNQSIPELKHYYARLFIKSSTHVAAVAHTVDTKVIDGSVHLVAYTHVVLAHLISFFDRHLLDGIFTIIARTVYYFGLFFKLLQSTSARKMIQTALAILWILYLIFTFGK